MYPFAGDFPFNLDAFRIAFATKPAWFITSVILRVLPSILNEYTPLLIHQSIAGFAFACSTRERATPSGNDHLDDDQEPSLAETWHSLVPWRLV